MSIMPAQVMNGVNREGNYVMLTKCVFEATNHGRNASMELVIYWYMQE